MMPEQLGTIVSESIWEKFDLDTFNSSGSYLQDNCSSFDFIPETFESRDCSKYSQILSHDCMWVGLCVSEEHNNKWATKNLGVSSPKIVPAGENLLTLQSSTDSMDYQQQEQFLEEDQHSEEMDGSESDKSSETPQSSSSSYEHYGIEEEVMAYLSASPSEVTGQYLRSSLEIKDEVTQTDLDYLSDVRSDNTASQSTEVDNTLLDRDDDKNDHNLIEKFDHLDVQSSSGSDEEIDVVHLEQPASIFSSASTEDPMQSTVKPAVNDYPVPRRRGRPPKTDKKSAAVPRLCQKQTINKQKNIDSSTNRKKYSSPASIYSEDDSDTDKRSIYNKMERKRRTDMNNALCNLKCLIPNLQYKVNASVISTLHEGNQYCREIYKTKRNLMAQKLELEKQQYKLMSKLSALRRYLALRR